MSRAEVGASGPSRCLALDAFFPDSGLGASSATRCFALLSGKNAGEGFCLQGSSRGKLHGAPVLGAFGGEPLAGGSLWMGCAPCTKLQAKAESRLHTPALQWAMVPWGGGGVTGGRVRWRHFLFRNRSSLLHVFSGQLDVHTQSSEGKSNLGGQI